MVHTVESKLDPSSRHFGFNKLKARSSTSLVGKARRPLQKQQLTVPSRHISRKDLFYGSHSRNGQALHNIRKNQAVVLKSKVGKPKDTPKAEQLQSLDDSNKTMHPEQVQLSHPVENLVEAKLLKPQEVVEDEINIEDVDNGDFNGSGKEEQNGNGVHLKENGHPQQLDSARNEVLEEKIVIDSNGKPFLRVKSSRRNSTSSRSSSVSSAPSLKHQTPMAMQMEVSMDYDERDRMDPLIMDGNAEDLEVSMSASHDEADDGATTDSEAITEQNNDPYEFDDDLEPEYEPEILHKKNKSVKAVKGAKTVKASPKPKTVKSKTPRAKSLKSKASKSSPKLSEKLLEEIDAENSDTNSLYKDDTESEDLNIKTQKSPKRSKTTPTKLDVVEESEGDGKGGEAEHVPRRSSRSRQTPQKYNSSLYADWDHPLVSEDRMNNSDAVYGASIRSVKGRRSLRKSRNISVLNTSLHNESSPWDNDFKVLTPCGGGVSIHNVPDADNLDSSTPLKRKAVEEDDDIENERGQKKMCVENTDLNTSSSSHTSSFFSVITSPIIMLKNKFRGSTVSSSTPVRENKPAEVIEQDTPSEIDINMEKEASDDVVLEKEEVPEVEGSMEESIDVDVVTPAAETPAVEVAPEAKSWCSIM